MANPKRASARPSNADARPPGRRRFLYTPELLANGRRRYEQTTESVDAIAADFGIARRTLRNLADKEGWVRYVAPAHDLPAHARMLDEAAALEKAQAAETHAQPSAFLALPLSGGENESDACSPSVEASTNLARPPDAPQAGEEPLNPEQRAAMMDRLYRSVDRELAIVEAMRARLRNTPQAAQEAERTARTLANLTATFNKLERMRCGLPDTDNDDIPTDIDELRQELARRIAAFMESRGDDEDAFTPDPAPPDDA